jgi:tetratricopeptide (TPR) repeat protein
VASVSLLLCAATASADSSLPHADHASATRCPLGPPSSDGKSLEAVAAAKDRFEQGVEHHHAGRYEEAAAAFIEAYRQVPNRKVVYNVASTYERAGRTELATACFRRYLELDPSSPQRAEVERRLKELQQPLPAQPNRADILGGLATVRLQTATCWQRFPTDGTATATVTFTISGDGTVVSARPNGALAEAPVGRCLADEVRKARFIRFSGPPPTLRR